MKRSCLRNKFLNTRSELDRKAYNKQRNYVIILSRKGKKNFYSNLNTSVLTENIKAFTPKSLSLQLDHAHERL